MFQNLRVDIIYYKTNTDFEMEFNLCGCCRMRLLTDKSADKKMALHSLARAVSRSKIIIITGALFGEDGVINLVSKAIESTLEKVDNKAFGISGDDNIEILKGATPLVTADGYFGGCIIESGPQTMILISENKSIRKPIMEKLIHPYIEKVCAMELNEKAGVTTDTTENELNESLDDLTVLEEEYEAVAEELIGEQETEEVEEEDAEDGEESDLLIENNDETDLEDSVSIEEEYENMASALLTDEEGDDATEEIDEEDDESELPLILEEEDNRAEYYLDQEYKNIADALLTEEDSFQAEEEVDTEISDGVESQLLMEDENEEDPIDLDDEYIIVADSLYTDEENSDNDIEESDTDITESEKFVSSGMIFDYDDAENSDSKAVNEKINKKQKLLNSLLSINVFILLVVAVLLIVLAILCYCIFFVPQSNGMDTVEYIKETFNTLFGKV